MKKNDRKQRCHWVKLDNPLYVKYHDKEWGRPVHNDTKHFEMLTLEGAQAGLSWETVLNKRENYHRLFANFSVNKVAKFTQKDISKILADPGIIRNRLKVESTVTNAKAFLKIQKEFGSFDKYIWGFAKPFQSKLISKDLKKRGFRFVGETIIYSYMQAVGLINDHEEQCYLSDKNNPWYVYILECKDKSLYTGMTNNIQKRIQEHQQQSKKSAKYLRGKGPLRLVFTQEVKSKSMALRLEIKIKKLSKEQKEELIQKGSHPNLR